MIQLTCFEEIQSCFPLPTIAFHVFLTDLSSRRIIRCLGFPMALLNPNLRHFLEDMQSWKCANNLIIFLGSQKPVRDEFGSLKVGPDSIRTGLYLGFLVKDDAADGMQGNGIPHQLQAMKIPQVVVTQLYEEIASDLGRVHFDSLVFR